MSQDVVQITMSPQRGISQTSHFWGYHNLKPSCFSSSCVDMSCSPSVADFISLRPPSLQLSPVASCHSVSERSDSDRVLGVERLGGARPARHRRSGHVQRTCPVYRYSSCYPGGLGEGKMDRLKRMIQRNIDMKNP